MPDPVASELAGGTSTSANPTVSFSAPAAGTLLLLHVASDDYRATSGTGRPESTGWTFLAGQEGNLGLYVWWKIATGAETSVQYKINSATNSAYAVTGITNIDTTTPLGANTSGKSIVSGATTNYTTPSITPGSGQRWIVVATVGATGNNTTGPYSFSGSYTEIHERYTTSGYRPGLGVAARVMDGGTSTSTTMTYATNGDQGMAVHAAWLNAAGGTDGTQVGVKSVGAGQVLPGTHAATRNEILAGTDVTGSATALTGAFTGSATFPGTTASGSAQGLTGQAVGTSNATLAGAPAHGSGQALGGTATGTRSETLSGTPSVGSAQAPTGQATAGQSATHTGTTSYGSAQAATGSATATRSESLPGTPAVGTGQAAGGTMAAGQFGTLLGAPATGSAQATGGQATGTRNATFAGTPAVGSSQALSGAPIAGQSATFTGATARGSGQSAAGLFAATRSATLEGLAATATAQALAGLAVGTVPDATFPGTSAIGSGHARPSLWPGWRDVRVLAVVDRGRSVTITPRPTHQVTVVDRSQ